MLPALDELVSRANRVLAAATPQNLSMMDGVSGYALLACELARLDSGVDPYAWAARCIEQLNATGGNKGLHDGIAGMGLVFALYLDGVEDVLAQIDEALLPHLRSLPVMSLRMGPAGIAQYASLRAHTESGRALCEAIVSVFAERAVTVGDSIVWDTPEDYALRRDVPFTPGVPLRGELGMAHGLSGALVGLSSLLHAGVVSARPLLEGAIRWVYAHNERQDSGWCKGSAGVACAMAIATATCGQAVPNAESLLNNPLPTRIDMCCGSTAIAQVLVRLGFVSEAQKIFERSFARIDTLESTGFQFGHAGVLLALLSHVSRRAPTWDCVLGMSIPLREA